MEIGDDGKHSPRGRQSCRKLVGITDMEEGWMNGAVRERAHGIREPSICQQVIRAASPSY